MLSGNPKILDIFLARMIKFLVRKLWWKLSASFCANDELRCTLAIFFKLFQRVFKVFGRQRGTFGLSGLS